MPYEDKCHNTPCCISGCLYMGIYKDEEDRWFCSAHWKEIKEDPTVAREGDDDRKVCAVLGCGSKNGLVQRKTGKVYCSYHAWSANPDDGADLRLPEVSDKIREECLRELEDGKFDKWRIHGRKPEVC